MRDIIVYTSRLIEYWEAIKRDILSIFCMLKQVSVAPGGGNGQVRHRTTCLEIQQHEMTVLNISHRSRYTLMKKMLIQG